MWELSGQLENPTYSKPQESTCVYLLNGYWESNQILMLG